tara:strand:+ start:504 stop:1985 length:1482 start_codon:yes stop_codon:yes gene_type:complete
MFEKILALVMSVSVNILNNFIIKKNYVFKLDEDRFMDIKENLVENLNNQDDEVIRIKTKYFSLSDKKKIKSKDMPPVEEIYDKLFKLDDNKKPIKNDSYNVFILFFIEYYLNSAIFHTSDEDNNYYFNNIGYIENLYGETRELENLIRSFKDGKLVTNSNGGIPKYKDLERYNGKYDDEIYKADDYIFGKKGRINFTNYIFNDIFIKEHNNVCDQLIKDNPNETDQWYFIRAKIIIHFKITKIAYDDYIFDFHHDKLKPLIKKYMKNVSKIENNFLKIKKNNVFNNKGLIAPREYINFYKWHHVIPYEYNINDTFYTLEDLKKMSDNANNFNFLIMVFINNKFNKSTLNNTEDFFKNIIINDLRKSRELGDITFNNLSRKLHNKNFQSFNEFFEEENRIIKNLYQDDVDKLELIPSLLFNYENDHLLKNNVLETFLNKYATLNILSILNILLEECEKKQLVPYLEDISLKNIILRNTSLKDDEINDIISRVPN